MPHFYVITHQEFGSYFDTEVEQLDPVRLGEAPRCEACGRFIGMKPWLPPLRARLTLHGQSWGDFAFFSGGRFVVSERAKALFDTGELTGLHLFEQLEIGRVRARKAAGAPPAYYYPREIKHSTATVDRRQSTFASSADIPREETLGCDVCLSADGFDAIGGIVMEESTWGGEDVFYARGLGEGTRFGSEHLREIIELYELTNIELVPSEEYRWDPLHLLDSEHETSV